MVYLKKGLKAGLLLTSVLLLAACGEVGEPLSKKVEAPVQGQTTDSVGSGITDEETKDVKSRKESMDEEESIKTESGDTGNEESSEETVESDEESSEETVELVKEELRGFDPSKYELGLDEYEPLLADNELIEELLQDDYLKVGYDDLEEITEYEGKDIAEHLEELNYEVSYESAKQVTEFAYHFKGLSEEEQNIYLNMIYTQSSITTALGSQILGQTVSSVNATKQLYKDLDEELGVQIKTFDELMELIVVNADTDEGKEVLESEAYATFMDAFEVGYALDISQLNTIDEVNDAYEVHKKEVESKEFSNVIQGADLNYIHEMVNYLRLARVVIYTSKTEEMPEEELVEFFNKQAEKEQEAQNKQLAEQGSLTDSEDDAADDNESKQEDEQETGE